jgi:Domain of unknown function (DUF4281)
MTGPEIVFQLVSVSVLPFWLLMIVLPHWRVTRWVMQSHLVLAPLPLLYVCLVVPHLGEVLPLLVDPKLADMARFLGTPAAALVGWIHFLAFDLFVGRWIYLDSRARQINAWLMAPILFLTLLLGPCGLLAYLSRIPWTPSQPPTTR